jgi:predicted ATPase
MNLKKFGEQLQTFRKRTGLSQGQLVQVLEQLAHTGAAEEYRVLDSTLISRWEHAWMYKGRQWKPTRQYVLYLIRVFTDQLNLDIARQWAAQAGYQVSPAELQHLLHRPLPTPIRDQEIRGEEGREPRRGGRPFPLLPDLSAGWILPPFLTLDQPKTNASIFVGRARELAELAVALEKARAGQGQIRFVIGGAGRGKTVLVQEFVRQAEAKDAELLVVSGSCNAHTGIGDPYLPLREALTMLAGEVETQWAGGLITTAHARRLWEAMPITLPALVEHAPDLIDALVPAKALYERAATFAPLDARWFQHLAKLIHQDQEMRLEERRLFAQYTALLKAVAAHRPLLLLFEDLHWVDAASNGLLFHLSRALGDSRILLVGTYRPDELLVGRGGERHPLAGVVGEFKRRHGEIWLDLGDLPPAEGRQFVDAYLDTQPNRLGHPFREALFRRTEGHALFTVELLRAVQERGDLRQDAEGYWIEGGSIDWQTLPARVEGVIEQRLDRLPAALQAVLTAASVEGEVFTAEVVARVQRLDERELVQRFSRELDRQHRLVNAQALEWIGQQRLSRYRFRHQLFQQYLYQRLVDSERAYLHEAVGQALEALYGAQTEHVAVPLARHFAQAGLTEKAVAYLLQAGEQAQRLSANQEAIHHLTQGLAMLKTLPDTPAHARQELALQLALGNALAVVKGYGAPEVGETYSRAQELCRQVGEMPQRFTVLHGLFGYHNLRNELQTARALAEQMLRLAQNQPDPTLLVPAHHVLGNNLLFLGEFGLAREHLEQGITFYDALHHRAYVRSYGQDEGVACLANLGAILWLLGYPDQALQRSRQALTLAQTLSHPFSLAIALNFATLVHWLRQEAQATQQHAEALLRLATEQGFALVWPIGVFYQGLLLVRQGQVEEGIAQLERALTARRATGSKVDPPFLLELAAAYGQTGRAETGLNLLAEALVMMDKHHDHIWEAALHQRKGELLLVQHSQHGSAPATSLAEAEACFYQAIELARRQQARSFELRATVCLCRLWRAQGKGAAAHQLLAEVYGWFTEGFDTADLKEARALLDELQAACTIRCEHFPLIASNKPD